MTEYNEGLCSTCKHSSKCIFMKGALQAVQFCEEYEPGPSRGKRGNQGIAPGKRTGLDGACSKGAGGNGSQPLGLCSNCSVRESCVFPKPESGVWHCEEYR